MPAQFTEISYDDFSSFMSELGFQPAEMRGQEYVFERTFKHISARVEVYSSITPGRVSRGKGKDAIRVVVSYQRPDGRWSRLGKQRRVHRVARWRDNLKQRIEEARTNIHPKPCPYCGSVMLLRNGTHGSFYSCSSWPTTGCQGKASSG